jgi:hypothetical protein
MRYRLAVTEYDGQTFRSVIVDHGGEQFTAIPAVVGNPVYDSFLESQGLTDADVQAMEPDEWHDMAASVI